MYMISEEKVDVVREAYSNNYKEWQDLVEYADENCAPMDFDEGYYDGYNNAIEFVFMALGIGL